MFDLHSPQFVAAAAVVRIEVEPGAHHRDACIQAGTAAAAAAVDVRHLPGRGVGRLVRPQLVAAAAVVRIDLKYSNGGMPHDQLMSSIELYAKEVAPIVREAITDFTPIP